MTSDLHKTLLWTSGGSETLGRCVAYVVDASCEALTRLSHVMTRCGDALLDPHVVPHQEQECLVVAALNLCRLQFVAAVENSVSGEELGLFPGSSLLGNLKQKIVSLATTPGVLPTIQKAAQGALQCGWAYLLPTPEERTSALSDLLPSAASVSTKGGSHTKTAGFSAAAGSAIGPVGGAPDCSGRSFMLDLLVASLMADGGLEAAIDQGIAYEVDQVENGTKKEGGRTRGGLGEVGGLTEPCGGLPLLHLLSQLLRNVSSLTNARLLSLASLKLGEHSLSQIFPSSAPSYCPEGSNCGQLYGEECTCCPRKEFGEDAEAPASVQLLLRFQRILVCRLINVDMVTDLKNAGCQQQPPIRSSTSSEGCGLLLGKYVQQLVALVTETLSLTTSLLPDCPTSLLPLLYTALSKDLFGVLAGELTLSLLVVCQHSPLVAVASGLLKPLVTLMTTLDQFNRACPNATLLDQRDLGWPGVFEGPPGASKTPTLPVLRKEDVENHNRGGGLWVVLDDRVYDAQLLRCCSVHVR
ncbi:Cytochrome b5-like heme/steroid binding domain [Trinorchestia longiramus]|nr:Cytochrome b5-like heme/steroid binding domain [Trinorchestia longiramus]